MLFIKSIRRLRLLKIFFLVKDIKLTIYSLLQAIPAMANTFVCLIVVFLFYTIWGLHLFQGNEEYRCRKTPQPILMNGRMKWEMSDIEFLCGYWKCPKGTYCGSPADFNIPFDEEELNSESINYGFITFTNFYKSLLTVIHFFSISSWSSINYTVH